MFPAPLVNTRFVWTASYGWTGVNARYDSVIIIIRRLENIGYSVTEKNPSNKAWCKLHRVQGYPTFARGNARYDRHTPGKHRMYYTFCIQKVAPKKKVAPENKNGVTLNYPYM